VYLYGNFIVFSMRLWLDPKVSRLLVETGQVDAAASIQRHQ
jgi:hypothetical protein